jgi:hypothetical protein
MTSLREIEERVVANGRVEGHEVRLLRERLYADGKIDRDEADFLVVVHKRTGHHSDQFQQFYYDAIKRHILEDGRITAEETEWIRQMIERDETLEDEERRFLEQLRGEAREVSPEFEAFYQGCMKRPPERHTAGG